MSEESLADKAEGVSGEPKGWGVFSGTLWAAAVFLVPQALVVALMFTPLGRWLRSDDNVTMFLLQASVQLMTLAGTWMVVRAYKLGPKSLGLGRVNVKDILLAAASFPVYLVCSVLLTYLVTRFLHIDLDQEQMIGFTTPNFPELVLVFVALVVITPFVEEVVFRGLLYRPYVRALGPVVATLAISVLFAVAHGQVNVALDVFVLSLFLGYLRYKTDSLWPAVTLHMTKNFVAFYVLFIMGVR